MKLSNEEILDKIEKLNYWEIKDFISSLDLTPDQMEFLANHENEWVRGRLVENPNLTEEIMIKLSSDENMDVKLDLAQTSNLTSEKVMIKLSKDKDWQVRQTLAHNPNLPKNLMIKLSSDEKWEVRQWLANNPKITEKLIIRLSSDEVVIVNYAAFEKLKNLKSLSSDDLESAYDLILKSKYINKKNFKNTFNYIIDRFPELSKLAKMFKKLILKLKKDLK